jgi:acetolactate synthase-1/2/3 large subunit
VVEALGGYGERVTGPKEIRPALERARASGKPACVNVMVDPNVFSSGTMNQTVYKERTDHPGTPPRWASQP